MAISEIGNEILKKYGIRDDTAQSDPTRAGTTLQINPMMQAGATATGQAPVNSGMENAYVPLARTAPTAAPAARSRWLDYIYVPPQRTQPTTVDANSISGRSFDIREGVRYRQMAEEDLRQLGRGNDYQVRGSQYSDRARQILAKYGLADYTNEELLDAAEWKHRYEDYGSKAGEAYKHLGGSEWSDLEGDEQHRKNVDLQVQAIEREMARVGPTSPSYAAMKYYHDQLVGMQGVYKDRANLYGSFSNQYEYDVYRHTQKELDTSWKKAEQQGQTRKEWADGLAADADKADAKAERAQWEMDVINKQLEVIEQVRGMAYSDEAMQKMVHEDGTPYTREEVEARYEYLLKEKEKYQKALDDAEYARTIANAAKDYSYQQRYSDLREQDDWQSSVEAGRTAWAPVEKAIAAARANRAAETRAGNVEVAGLSDEELAGEDYYTYRTPGVSFTNEERNTWYYLYNRDPEEAFEYAIGIHRRNKARARAEQMQRIQEWGGENWWHGILATGYDLIAWPTALWDTAGNLFQYANTGLVMPNDVLSPSDYGDALTAGVAAAMNNWGTIPDYVPILGGKGWGEAYQLGISIAQSMEAAALGGGAANVLFFGAAAKHGTEEALARGASDGQAIIYGLWCGAAEVLGETVSVEHLVHLKDAGAVKSILKNILIQGGIEASEEVVTTMINTVGDAIVMGDKSELETNARAYMAQGMSKDEAYKRAWREWSEGIILDAVGGFLSGGISSGATYASRGIRGAHTAYSGDQQALLTLAEQQGNERAVEKAREIREKGYMTYNDSLVLRESIPEYALSAFDEQQQSAEQDQIRQDASRSLLAQGAGQDTAQRYAELVMKDAAGEKMTRAERAQYREAYNAPEVQTAFRTAKDLQNERDIFRSVAARDQMREAKARIREEKMTRKLAEQRGGDLHNVQLKQGGGYVKVKSAEMQKGKLALTYETPNGDKTATVDELKLDEYQQAAFRSLTQILGKDAAAAYNGMSLRTMENGGFSIIRYASAFANVRDLFGAKGASLEAAKASSISRGLTAGQVEQAWTIGRQMMERGETRTEERPKSKRGTGSVSTNGFTYKDSEGKQQKMAGVKNAEAVMKSRKGRLLQALAKSLGIDVVLFEGDAGSVVNGAYDNGTIYLEWSSFSERAEGKGSASWVMFRTMSHELTHFIQQNSKDTYAELKDFITGYLRDFNGLNFNALVAEKIAREPGISYDRAIDEVVADACETMLKDSKAARKLMRENMTLWEKICDFVSEFLDKIEAQDEAAKALRPVIDQVREIWDRGLMEAVASREQALDKLSEGGREIVESLGENAEVQVDKNGDMVLAESEDGNTKVFSMATYEESGKKKLIQALKENGHTQEEIDAVIENIEATGDFLEKLAQQYSDSHGYENLKRNLWAGITTNLKTGKQIISALVNNGDYPVNIDLQLICKKRVAYMRMLTRLIDDGVFEKVNFKGAAIADLNAILRDGGFETACLGCFVESRRLQLQAWAETIVEEWNDEVDKRKQNAGGFNFAQGGNKLSAEDILNLSMELENAGKKNDKGNLNLGKGSVKVKMGRLLDKVPSLAQHLTVADLLTPDGLKVLRSYDQNLFSLVKQRYGAASPKIVQDFNPYNSEMADLSFQFVKKMIGESVKGSKKYMDQAKKDLPRQKGESTAEYNRRVETLAVRNYLYDIGGARIQSFSDFMIENVFDYMQIVADMAAREFPMHGYSKEAIFLRLFGMTGGKFNGSLIAHVEGNMGKEYAGLLPVEEASNGRGIVVEVDGKKYAICFDDYARHAATGSFIQSIGMKDIVALQLDPRYSKNVGSITIGVSDKQILAMLDSPYFRMVIPYHASGMIPEFAKLVGVDNYNDYTDYQTTKVDKCFDLNGNPVEGFWKADGKKVEIDTHYNFNEAVQRLGDAKKAAQEYLDWCPQRHKVYDGKKLVGYATFQAKFSDSPYGTDFTQHENYYKLLEDFNSYDSIGEASALQGAVTMTLPSEANRLTAEQMTAYKQALRDTGLFSEKEIEKYAKKADMSFQELIQEEIGNRAEYESRQAKVWDETVDKAEQMLLEKYGRVQASTKQTAEQVEAEAVEMSDVNTQFSVRKKDPPKKTMIGYKVFMADKRHPGQLYPTKVKNPGGQGTPVGVWLDADTGEIARNPDGSIATNSRGRISVKANGGTLAWRPGWHLGSLPEANQMNRVDPKNPESNNSNRGTTGLMWDNYVFCECEFAADEDYQLEAFEFGTDEKGRYNHTQAGLPYIPKDGYYKYRTNPDPSTAPWFISGSIRITKILDDDMRREIIEKWNAEHPDQPMRFTERYSGKPINLADYGLKAGPVAATEDLSSVAPGVDYSDEIRNLPGYTRHALNFDDPNVQEAFRIQQIEDRKDYYVDKYNREHREELEGNKKAAVVDGSKAQLSVKDAEYVDAVKRGDMDTAQRMVDEAAKAAGYTVKAFHGTRSFGFTVFDPSRADDGISLFVTSNRRTAETYSGETNRNRIKDRETKNADDLHGERLIEEARKYKKRYEDYKLMSDKDKATVRDDAKSSIGWSIRRAQEFVRDHRDAFDSEKAYIMDRLISSLYHLRDSETGADVGEAWTEWEDALWDLKGMDDSIAIEFLEDVDSRGLFQNKNVLDDMTYQGDMYADWYVGGPDYIFDNQLQIELNAEYHKGIYELWCKPGKQLVFDANGENWNQITPPKELQDYGLYGPQRTRDISSAAKALGYDSVLMRNLRDNGGETAYNGASDVSIFFDANALKSADPVTYDDKGEVIPLSERFNQQTGDIRFSVRSDAKTDRELLKDAYREIKAKKKELSGLEKQQEAALEKFQKQVETYEAKEREVTAALDELDRLVQDGTDPKAVTDARAKVSAKESQMANALNRLTESMNGTEIQEILQRERKIQRERTSAKLRESVSRRELRGKINKLWKDLNARITKPSETKHIPAELMQQTMDVLEALNMDTSREGTKSGEKLRSRLANLKQRYSELRNDPDFEKASVYDPVIEEMLGNMIAQVGDTPINKMSVSQMEIVYNVLKAMDHTARAALKLKLGEIEVAAYTVAKEMTKETRSVKKQRGFGNAYLKATLSPQRMFNRLGGHHKNSVWSRVATMLNDGQLKQTQLQMEGSMIFEDLLASKSYEGMIDPKKTVDVGLKDENGKAIPITHGMMVSLYLHLMNEQNRRHVAYGGLTIPALKDYYNGKKVKGSEDAVRVGGALQEIAELKDQLHDAEKAGNENEIAVLESKLEAAQIMAESFVTELQQTIEQQLTDYDRQWIAACRELFDGFSKRVLNETTMAVYGIKKANVENYFPIWVDGDFLNTPFESVSKDMSLENAGFMKERVDSSKPIRLGDVSDVTAQQIRKVAQYCGMMPAIRDFGKIWGKTETGYRDSLQKAVHDTFGDNGVKYIENLMADLNGARSGENDAASEFFNRVRGHMAQASLTMSLRVALGQTASYPTAAAVLGWDALHKALWHGGRSNRLISRADQELIRKWSPLLYYRMKGYSNTELGDIAGMNDKWSRLWKKARWLTGWIQAMDGATVGRLWYAAEYWVQDHNKALVKGTDSYYEAVAKKFNEVVELTQPNYTAMQRPDILRNPNALVKQLTMFLTQRLQNFNILYDAAATYSAMKEDFKAGRNGVTREDVKQAAVQTRTAVVSQLAAAATITVFKFLADVALHSLNAYRDDEDKELHWQSVCLGILDMFIDSLAGNFLGGSEVWDLAESLIPDFNKSYYGIEVSGVGVVNDLIDAGLRVFTKGVKGELNWKDTDKLIKQVGTILGIPYANAEKIVMAAVYYVQDAVNGEWLWNSSAGVDRTTAQQATRLLRAYREADGAKVNKILAEVPEDKRSSVYETVRKQIKKDFTDGKITIYEALRQMQKYGNASDQVMANFIKDQLADGKINGKQAEELLVQYGGRSEKSAEETVTKVEAKAETGIAYDDIDDSFMLGQISRDDAKNALVRYGMDEDKAEMKVNWWEYQKNNPGTSLTESGYEAYITKYQAIGLSMSQYEYYAARKQECQGTDANNDGKADRGSKKAQVVELINSMDLTPAQKDEMYLANGYAKSGLVECPWNR